MCGLLADPRGSAVESGYLSGTIGCDMPGLAVSLIVMNSIPRSPDVVGVEAVAVAVAVAAAVAYVPIAAESALAVVVARSTAAGAVVGTNCAAAAVIVVADNPCRCVCRRLHFRGLCHCADLYNPRVTLPGYLASN